MGYFFKTQTPEYISDSKWILNKKDFVPAYLKTYEADKHIFEEKVEKAMSVLKNCEVCPRDCHVDRLANKTAVCRTGRYAQVASAFAHFGEEDCLRGWKGSGTIFFSFCNLKCVFCQNFDISWEGGGQTLKPEQLVRVMIHLQEKGCHNINFVTPEHVVPQIMEAIPLAIEMGLNLPIVYNTSAYDSVHSLDLMDGIVDVYMPDFKFWDNELSFLYMAARDYPGVARTAIKEMHDQVGDLKFDDNGLALRGILLRHLVMPNRVADTKEICRFISQQISKDTYINIMDQYRPEGRVLKKPEKYTYITRRTSTKEYLEAVEIARDVGLYRIDTRWMH
ncbi:MAG: radical SAM protein [Candidatus Dadabacteria bacterium]|nr:radical SAM protein [Candidatus Dadabacteria bacterium]NIS08947.1 radical SAM protein [Candidatus Dadabacteria bacterium]NIV41662.1 radical SAM protein [Candidatus Dadabacteria bacterium]NIY21386.1 radical SAM protein [Candidatus Dadabacteria bacterium]